MRKLNLGVHVTVRVTSRVIGGCHLAHQLNFDALRSRLLFLMDRTNDSLLSERPSGGRWFLLPEKVTVARLIPRIRLALVSF